MVVEASKHINTSQEDLKHILSEVKSLVEGLDEKTLNRQEGEGKWSMLQCLKHLSIAVNVYNNNSQLAMSKSSHQTPASEFKSHWKGDMFVKMISPRDNGELKNNMKTMKSMNPESSLNAEATINEFFQLHEQFIGIMEQSRDYNINRVKVNTAIGPLVKLRLGDAYRFIIGHAQRHLIQLKRIHLAVS